MRGLGGQHGVRGLRSRMMCGDRLGQCTYPLVALARHGAQQPDAAMELGAEERVWRTEGGRRGAERRGSVRAWLQMRRGWRGWMDKGGRQKGREASGNSNRSRVWIVSGGRQSQQ